MGEAIVFCLCISSSEYIDMSRDLSVVVLLQNRMTFFKVMCMQVSKGMAQWGYEVKVYHHCIVIVSEQIY